MYIVDLNQYAIELVTYLLVLVVYFYELIVYMLLEKNAIDSIAFFLSAERCLKGGDTSKTLKKTNLFNFILGEWKRSKSGFFAYIRRHYLTSKKQFFHDRKIQNGGNMTDPVDSVAANVFCGRQLSG